MIPSIGPLEELVLLAVQGLQPCYVADIVQAINRAGYNFSDDNGSMHNVLDRLEGKACVAKMMTPPRPVRGGRSRKSYHLTEIGLEALERAEVLRQSVRQGIPLQSEIDRLRRIEAEYMGFVPYLYAHGMLTEADNGH